MNERPDLARVLRRIGYHVEQREPGVVTILGIDRHRSIAWELAGLLAGEPHGLSAAELARRARRRRADVLRVLHRDDRFEQRGSSRSSRWHHAPVPGYREQVQQPLRAAGATETLPEALAAAERLSAARGQVTP